MRPQAQADIPPAAKYMSDSQEVFSSLRFAFLAIAAIPFIYYLLALFSSLRFFGDGRRRARESGSGEPFLPPVSILKPVRGLDPGAYENFASFCRLDYPEYEILFCVGDTEDPALAVLDRLVRDFPHTKIRVFVGSEREATQEMAASMAATNVTAENASYPDATPPKTTISSATIGTTTTRKATTRRATNDKCAKLARLTDEAAYEHLAINDSDVRVEPDYLRRLMAPLANPRVGAVTTLYVPLDRSGWIESLQEAGMLSEFYPGLFVARDLDGVKFALGPTIATCRSYLREFGGYAAIENRPADDLLIGRLTAEQGREVVLLPYAITTVPDFQSLHELFMKRLRWMTVMRHMRPAGHLGLIFTLGLPWMLLALVLAPNALIAWSFLGGYLLMRGALTLLVGRFGLGERGLWREVLLVPLWDAMATLIWLVSFTRRTIRWRGHDYAIVNGQLVPAHSRADFAAEGARDAS